MIKPKMIAMKNHSALKKESGNVFFLILVAVALFAALAYIISQSTRSGDEARTDTLKSQISEVVNYGIAVKTAISLLTFRGCGAEELAFDAPDITALDIYRHTPDAHNKCRLFHPQGGQMSYQLSKIPNTHYEFWGNNTIGGIKDDEKSDLIMVLNLGTGNSAFCSSFNKAVDIGDSIPVIGTAFDDTPFTGTYADSSVLAIDSDSGLYGRALGCAEMPGSGEQVIYQVILER